MWNRWLKPAILLGLLLASAPAQAQDDEVVEEADVAEEGQDEAPSGDADVDALIKQGAQQLKKGQWEEAIATFQAALEKAPASKAAYQGLGRALIKRKDWDGAISAYQAGFEKLPDWDEALYRLGYIYRKKGDYGQAITFYTRYLERDPENPDAYFGLGESYRKDAQPRKAVEAFKAYISKEKRPGEQKWVERARQVVKALEEELGDEGAAVAEVEGQEPEVAAPIPEGDAASLLAKADRAYGEKNLKRAAQLYRAASQKDGQGVEALYKLGVVQALLGDLPGAVASWQRVLERDPSMKLAQENITRARAKLDAQAQKGVDDPAWGRGLEEEIKLVRRYLEENRLPMAMRVLDPLTDKHPEDAQVRLLRGQALMRMGRFEEARGNLELALGANPGDAEVTGALGQVYLRLDQQERALYFLRLYLERVDPQATNPSLEPTRRTVARLAGDAQEP